jgi:formylglycine-generating enzyme required for sulfatase activity
MQAPMTIKQYVSQLRKIPGGRFTMGRTYKLKHESELFKDELPAHLVDISTFQMGATHVTVGMWREYVRANKQLSMPEVPDWDWIDDHPIVNVSWSDIMGRDGKGGYCAWASRVSGVRLSLPTEAQWEYAAKGGQRNLEYPWGNDWDPSKLWSSDPVTRTRTAPVVRTNDVCESDYGIVDMAGNTNQWTYCVYEQYRAQKRDRLGYPLVQANPKKEGAGVFANRLRVVRGGSWRWAHEFNLRCTSRYMHLRDSRLDDVGFRLSAGPK